MLHLFLYSCRKTRKISIKDLSTYVCSFFVYFFPTISSFFFFPYYSNSTIHETKNIFFFFLFFLLHSTVKKIKIADVCTYYTTDMIQAHATGSRINGYHGLSALMTFGKDFDIVWQVVIDKMHCVDTGVIKKMFDLFLITKGNKERYE